MLEVTVTRKVYRPEFQIFSQDVRIPGFDKLTPRAARAAIEIAFGQKYGGEVSDGVIAYRVYEKSARKVKVQSDQEWREEFFSKNPELTKRADELLRPYTPEELDAPFDDPYSVD